MSPKNVTSTGFSLTTPKHTPTHEATSQKASLASRVTHTALPFLSLYKPFNQPVAIASGAVRSICCLQQLVSSIRQGNTHAVPAQLAMVVLSTLSVAASIFAHPMGMILATGQDLISNVAALVREVQAGNNRKALECATHLTNNLLYIAVFFAGSTQLTVAYYGLQALSGLYHSASEFKKGNYIEGTGHMVMTMIRGYQIGSYAHAMLPRTPVAPKEEKPAAPSPQPEKPATPAVDNSPKEPITAPETAPEEHSSRNQAANYSHEVTLRRAQKITLEQASATASSNRDIVGFIYHSQSPNNSASLYEKGQSLQYTYDVTRLTPAAGGYVNYNNQQIALEAPEQGHYPDGVDWDKGDAIFFYRPWERGHDSWDSGHGYWEHLQGAQWTISEV